MKQFHISVLLVLILLGGTFSVAFAYVQDTPTSVKTIYVAKNGTDRNNGLTPEKPKRNLESTLYIADNGDTIHVGPGIYKCNIVINKNLTLIGNNQENTTIEGINTGSRPSACVQISSNATVTITGFTIKNGKRELYAGYSHGGGIENNGTLTLTDSTITNNTAMYGGGIYNKGTININRITLTNNTAGEAGGGILSDTKATMENSLITNNTANIGGGIRSFGQMELQKVTIKNNNAIKLGGGISVCSIMTIMDSTIINNTARETGGGISNGDTLYLYGSIVSNNRANNGGGIYNARNAYIDDLTNISSNIPNNFAGNAFIPA